MYLTLLTHWSYDHLNTHNSLESNKRDNETNIYYNSALQIQLLFNGTIFLECKKKLSNY